MVNRTKGIKHVHCSGLHDQGSTPALVIYVVSLDKEVYDSLVASNKQQITGKKSNNYSENLEISNS